MADGMGGHDAGDVASAKVTEALLRLPIVYGLDDLVGCAVAALEKVNRELIELAGSRESERSIGSTVVGLAIVAGRFSCFWAGDSRAYRIRDGQIVQLSRDHSLVQDLVDAGMVAPNDIRDHPNANVITRAVGATENLKVDTTSGDVAPGDMFLLASDGLTRPVEDHELAEVLTSLPAEEAADSLVERVLARGAPDNLSFIIVKPV